MSKRSSIFNLHCPSIINVNVLTAVAVAFAVSFTAADEMRHNGMKYFGASGDWISVRLEGVDADELPAVYADSGVRKVVVRHEVPDIGTGRGKAYPFFLNGELSATLRSWDGSFVKPLGTQTVVNWRHGQEKSFPLDLSGLDPDAYVVTVELPPHVRSGNVFNPTNTGGGSIGLPMLYGRNAMRLAVFPNVKPCNVFGVGNAMVHCLSWWEGKSLANTLEARDLKPVAVSAINVGCDAWYNALIQAFGAEVLTVDAPGPKDVPGMNSPVGGGLDLFSPAGREELIRRGEETGKRLAKDAGIATVCLGGERPQFNRGVPNPSQWADADFRAFCRTRYKDDLAAANKAWGLDFSSWEDVRQPLYDIAATNLSDKAASVEPDWFANAGRIGKKLVRHLNKPENLAIAMDWYRWRTKASIDMYLSYADAARKFDRKTLYSNNYAWPNFFAHLVLPVWRHLDAAGVDCQYVCGFPHTLGSNSEMIEILEMAESVMKGRPVIGWEIYIQPHYPEEMAAMQNWAMAAHGVTINMVFAWKPYADRGQHVFKNGPRAWERPDDACAMWMLIDTDGTRLPVYYGVKRSAGEIAAFHAKYDALSLKRIHGRTAVYVSDETSMYIMLKTGDEPYLEEKLCHSRNRIASGLRLGGARIEYLDDETIGELVREDYDAVVLPPTPYITDESAARLEAFEKAGGKVIRLEDWTNDFFGKHPEVTRSSYWKTDGEGADVEVVVRIQEKTGRKFVFILNRGKATTGRLAGTDFADGATFTDALTGEATENAFSLAPYGYRVLTISAKR